MPPRKPETGPSLRQVNIRLDPAYYAEIEETANMLGLDVAQLLRMIVRENFPTYRERGEEVRRKSAKGKSSKPDKD